MYAMVNAQLRLDLDELTQNWTHIRVRLLFTNHGLSQGNCQQRPLVPPGTPPQGPYARLFVAQRTTMAQLWWPRSSDYATCSTTREADSTAATDLCNIDILRRVPQPCACFISTISAFITNATLRYSRTTLDGDDRPRHRDVSVLYFG